MQETDFLGLSLWIWAWICAGAVLVGGLAWAALDILERLDRLMTAWDEHAMEGDEHERDWGI